jgi:sirohydrochlorin ferrochelatase
MEQDHVFGRDQPLSTQDADTALLLAAHGERRPGADNDGVLRIARALAGRALVSEVAVGFINGVPSIADAMASLKARRIIVYPLFASTGYFTRDRLVQLIDAADSEGRDVRILPPLGLDPGLPHLVAALVKRTAREHGFAARRCSVIFLAHGSRRNPASREATQQIARDVENSAVFHEVRTAFLEERPFLGETAADVRGPAIVVGLFSGEGMHGARDAPRLIAELGRGNIVFAGVIGGASGIDDLVARSVGEALLQDIRRRNVLSESSTETVEWRLDALAS